MLPVLKKNWFLIGIVIVICLAKIAPQIGEKGGKILVKKKYCRSFKKVLFMRNRVIVLVMVK